MSQGGGLEFFGSSRADVNLKEKVSSRRHERSVIFLFWYILYRIPFCERIFPYPPELHWDRAHGVFVLILSLS